MNAGVAVLGGGNGDLLNGVLQLRAGGFEALDQVGPVEEFHRDRLDALQPSAQDTPDRVAGMGFGEIVRGQAGQAGFPGLFLFPLHGHCPALEDRDRAEFSVFRVKGFLGHADRGVLVLCNQGMSEPQGLVTVIAGLVERPSGLAVFLEEDFVMDVAGHAPTPLEP